jgi:simple sugar transport system permease protein
MHSIFTVDLLAALVAGGVLAGMPLLLAALGETISEQAGVLNIGLEGMMLLGAYAGFVAAEVSGSSWLGFLAAAATGLVLSSLVALLCVYMGQNQIVVGIGVLLSMEGLTSLLHAVQYGETYERLSKVHEVSLPLLDRLPVLGPSLFSQPAIVYLTLLLAVLVSVVLWRTRWGLYARAAGSRPAALDAAGVNVARVRTCAVLCTGLLAGLGGGYLSIVSAGVFVPFMTQGGGFIAIVIAMLGRGRPTWVVLGAFLFGISMSFSTALQLAGIGLPTDVVQMLPFIVVILALIVFARRAILPAALATPFVRGGQSQV